MKRILNLPTTLLLQGRKLHRLGLYQQALTTLTQLSQLRNLPPGHACEAHCRLAHLERRRRHLARCRRHLMLALLHQPANARHYYQLGQVTSADVRCDPAAALNHYRQALKLEPRNSRYLSAFGLLAVQQERTRIGLRTLRRASHLAPDDLLVLKRHVLALRYLGHPEEARSLIHAAMFRQPKDEGIRRLWEDHQFQVLRSRQEKERRRLRQPPVEQEPCLLPFQPTASLPRKAARVVRVDAPSTLPASHLPLSLPRGDQRFA